MDGISSGLVSMLAYDALCKYLKRLSDHPPGDFRHWERYTSTHCSGSSIPLSRREFAARPLSLAARVTLVASSNCSMEPIV